jgi:glutamyl-tRNA synthetase
MTIRTRVAPSPTGDPHVGTAYIALFNYCFAKKNGGEFILRIEDTDRTRSSLASEQVILRSLRWLGIEWSEGPDVGGPYGPYRQSDRGGIYREYAQKLLAGGHAFRCFCTPERLAELRRGQTATGRATGYDGKCKQLSAFEADKLAADGMPYVIRLDVPRSGVCAFDDYLRGKIEIEWATVDMQVLVKSDGMPTYHLANVVDDHLMKITHVIRGEEWVSSAPKHLLLYEYFGWTPPVLCHLPLLRNPDKSKLSKRKNPTSILYYERMGFLPEALINYLGLMGWSMPDGEEKFTLERLAAEFELERVSLGGPVFDLRKLTWLNGRWIRESLSLEEFAERVQRWALNRDYLMSIASLAQTRITQLSDLGPLTSFFFSGTLPGVTAELLRDAKLPPDDIRKGLLRAAAKFDELPAWNKEGVESVLRELADSMGYKVQNFLRPFYVAVTGSPASVPLFAAMELLGRDVCRHRIRHAIELLGGVSSKERSAWLRAPEAGGEA